MANLFKSIMNRSDDDEELDLEFDIHEAESNCFELPPDKENNQVLAVWGSPSSGKTTMSVKLARYIASQKKNVILVLADMTAPPLPYICPPSDLEDENSLGAILGAAHVTGNLIKQNAILHKRNEYLTMLAMKNGENAFSYPPFTETQAQELLSELRRMADYIIIDCTSNITNDVLSAVSLIESDAVLRLVSCDLKSISYLNSQIPLLPTNSTTQNLFFKSEKKREFSDVLNEVQSYISSKYSAPEINGVNNENSGNDGVKNQVKRYIGKHLPDYRVSVEGMSPTELIDRLYTEMAEFSFLTKYIFGTGIEEININSWDEKGGFPQIRHSDR